MGLYSSACKLSESNLNSWKTLTLENDLLRVTLLPEKGSDIIEFYYEPAQMDFLWKSNIGLRPKPVPSPDPRSPTPAPRPLPHDQFIEWYEGGWNQMLPSGGTPNTYAGVTYGLHGELWSLPLNVHVDEYRPGEVSVVLDCRLSMQPLSYQKRLTLRGGEAVLHIEETVTNESDKPVDCMLGHHPAIGAPFLNGDCVLDCPATECEAWSIPDDPAARLKAGTKHKWPMVTDKNGAELDLSRIPPPPARHSDEFFLTGLREPWCAVTDTERKLGFGMVWDPNLFRHVWIWQELCGGQTEPWDNCYVMGVEPYTSFPYGGLAGSVERNMHFTLPPRGSMSGWLKAIAYEGLERVSGITEDAAVL